MFIQYLEKGDIGYLLSLLRDHFSDLKNLARKLTTDSLKINIEHLDNITRETHLFLIRQFGNNWHDLNFEEGYEPSFLVDTALNFVKPEIQRLNPFYRNGSAVDFLYLKDEFLKKNLNKVSEFSIESLDSRELSEVVTSAINWFFENQLMHISAKALYETAFYYVWGRNSAMKRSGIAIGIDRDHAEYQYLAWKRGYNDYCYGDHCENSIVYARRSKKEIIHSTLNDISFRQFWR